MLDIIQGRKSKTHPWLVAGGAFSCISMRLAFLWYSRQVSVSSHLHTLHKERPSKLARPTLVGALCLYGGVHAESYFVGEWGQRMVLAMVEELDIQKE